jgi:hypothetical protein
MVGGLSTRALGKKFRQVRPPTRKAGGAAVKGHPLFFEGPPAAVLGRALHLASAYIQYADRGKSSIILTDDAEQPDD